MTPESQLIEILRKEGIVSESNLERALAHQRDTGGAPAEWLVSQGLVEESDLFFLLSRHLGVPAIPAERLNHLTLAPELRRRVSRQLAETCLLIPLDYDPGPRRLSVAMCDPSDLRTLERLRQTARVDSISAYLARRSDIVNNIRAIYSNSADDVAGEVRASRVLRDAALVQVPTDALETAETGVELIPGKVSLDASLAREISKLPRHTRRLSEEGERAGSAHPTLKMTLRSKDLEEIHEPPEAPSATAAAPDEVTKSPTAPARQTAPPVAAAAASQTANAPVRRKAATRLGRSTNSAPASTTPSSPSSGTPTMKILLPGRETAQGPNLEQAAKARKFAQQEARGAAVSGAAASGAARATQHPVGKGVDVVPAAQGNGIKTERDDQPGFVADLLAGIGMLAIALEQRVRPGVASAREYGRLTEMLSRELGLEQSAGAHVVVAARLYGLDEALRREAGSKMRPDVEAAFSLTPSTPGGLSAGLRRLANRALLSQDERVPGGSAARIVQLVVDFVALVERAEGPASTAHIGQLLRDGGADEISVSALMRVLRRIGRFSVQQNDGSGEEE